VCPFDDDDDLLTVKPRAIALWHAHQSLLSERDALKARVAELERQVKNHNKKRFGKSSERGETPTPAVPSAGSETAGAGEKAPHGPREQPHLVTEEVPCSLPDTEKTCDACGGQLDAWEGQTEDSPEIDVHVRGYVRRVYKRQKYRCRCGGCIKTAPAPLKPKEGSLYSIGFGVQAAVDKYSLHLPLHRQVEAMASAGLVIDSQTLWAQVDTVAFWSIGAYAAIRRHVLAQPVIGADETSWRLMDNKKGSAKGSEKWWIWLARAERAVVYAFEDNRGNDAGDKLLGGYKGVVMCDGYGVYLSLANRKEGLLLAHCWSHIRRDYVELEESAPGVAATMIGLIDELFRIERESAPEDLLRARTEQSKLVLSQIAEKALEIGLSSAPTSKLFTITKTMATQWTGLVRFVGDTRIPVHNNASEQSARGPVLGRKNHQGSRSKRGAKAAAVLYTLVESAKLSHIDPGAYLRLVVHRALRNEVPVLPHDVTAEMLVAQCGMDELMAKSAVAR
jgi:transposase